MHQTESDQKSETNRALNSLNRYTPIPNTDRKQIKNVLVGFLKMPVLFFQVKLFIYMNCSCMVNLQFNDILISGCRYAMDLICLFVINLTLLSIS